MLEFAVRKLRPYEKYMPVATFAAGFLWDSLTLTRVDRLSDNLILLGYLVCLAALILLTLRRRAGLAVGGYLAKLEPRFPWIIQFLLGGLLSSYVVFYFKSVSWTQTQFFFLLLVGVFVGNEFLHERLGNPLLLATLFFFCLFSFLNLFLPILLQGIGTGIFLAAGALSLAATLALFGIGFRQGGERSFIRMKRVAASTGAAYLLLNLFYFANLIPPVPLALKRAGIYHAASKTPAGYEVRYVRSEGWLFVKDWDDPFYLAPGDSAYCFTSIFAPRGIQVPVRHIWRRYDQKAGWTTTDRIAFAIEGGRDGGYRGFTRKQRLDPGYWRVEVETAAGLILGRIDFSIVPVSGPHGPMESRLIH